ncbi:hypothetical protein [Neosynechococcus sphagnicola]|uniref:hypothetical protein n=1 Tax=Neosynechococcus sphagnicola TaxID=1501145 RepID=UPI00068A9A90|nr:hypothetical protein [Neosynechococcus sphagnicola]
METTQSTTSTNGRWMSATAFVGGSAPKGCPSWEEHRERDGCSEEACNAAKDDAVRALKQKLKDHGHDACSPYVHARSTCQKGPGCESSNQEGLVTTGEGSLVTTIAYRPPHLDVAAAQPYFLTLQNNSGRDWVLYVYQTLPKQTSTMLSLAWFASPYPIAPQDSIEFQWFIDYNFVWGDTGILKPGIKYKASGPRDANPTTLNSTTFGYNSAGSPTLSTPQLDPENKGTLVINDLGNLPDLKFSVGIGMSGVGTFVEQAGPNLQHFFTPTPVYWVGAATERRVGDVLDIKTVTRTAPVMYEVGVFEKTMILNSSNQWVSGS